MKCKVIHGGKDNLERLVNEWLELEKPEIFKILQSPSDLYFIVTIFYYTKNEARAKKLEKLDNL